MVISDDLEVIKEGCAKSFAPFPKANFKFLFFFFLWFVTYRLINGPNK